MTAKKHNSLKNEEGYTLTELLVVLVIIALLTGLVAPRLIGRIGKAKTTTARTQIENLVSALDIYRLDMDVFPTTEQGLSALINAPSSDTLSVDGHTDGPNTDWQGPYLRRGKVPMDPWKRPYIYTLAPNGDTLLITSYGKDGSEGGEGDNADITSND